MCELKKCQNINKNFINNNLSFLRLQLSETAKILWFFIHKFLIILFIGDSEFF